MVKTLAVLGSTGSIGRQTLDVVKQHPELFEICSLTAGNNAELLAEQALEFKPRLISIMDETKIPWLKERLNGTGIEIYGGTKGLITAVEPVEINFVVTAVTGTVGLLPTVKAIQKGKHIGLANKETLVAAGKLIMNLARMNKVEILPVDSEHSAIFQCLNGENKAELDKLILTASGGPFRGWTKEQLEKVTVEMALKHPNWAMGKKITIDSATLINKGLEVIEARWLFDKDFDSIEVVVHPQSIIHSMVEFKDGSILAHLGVPDMRIPIQYALSYPNRLDNNVPRLNLSQLRELTFQPPDMEAFPCLKYAYEAGRQGGTLPAVLNASNEIAVELLLNRKISFWQIPHIIYQVMEKHQTIYEPSLEEILMADKWAREETQQLTGKVMA